MSLTAFLTAVTTILTPALPVGVKIEQHGGRFTERELPLLLAKAPCVLVSSLGISQLDPYAAATWRGQIQFAVYVIGADVSGQSRGPMAMDLAQTVMQQLLPDQFWGLNEDTCDPPDWKTARAENLYSGHINTLQVAIWTVTWTQTFTFSA